MWRSWIHKASWIRSLDKPGKHRGQNENAGFFTALNLRNRTSPCSEKHSSSTSAGSPCHFTELGSAIHKVSHLPSEQQSPWICLPKNGTFTTRSNASRKSRQILLFDHTGISCKENILSSWFNTTCLHAKGEAYKNLLRSLDEKDLTWIAAHKIHRNENRDWHQLFTRNLF